MTHLSPSNAMILPDEILSSIFSLLPQSHLLPITRVCRRLYEIVQPLLYRSIASHAKSEALHNDVPSTQYQSCHLLTRTLLNDPPLASLMKTFTMEARHPSILIEDLSTTTDAQGEGTLSFPSLKTLILRHAQIQGPTFRKLLTLTPKVEVLDCNFECDANPFDKYHAMFLDCSELGSALLSSLSATLVQLKISVEFVTSAALEIDNGGSYEGRDAWGIKGRLGTSLKGMRALRRLEVPWSVLLGWLKRDRIPLKECLPSELRDLVLAHDLGFFMNYEWDDERVCVSSLMEYVDADGAEDSSALRSLTVRFSGFYEDEEYPALNQDLWGELDKKCREVGCRLRVEGRELA